MSNAINEVSRLFGNFIKLIREYKFVRIIPLVNIDSILASSLLLKVFSENDINAVVSLKPSKDIEEPTIFIDIDPSIKNDKCLVILHDQSLNDIEFSKNVIKTNTSIFSLLLKVIEDYWIIGNYEKIFGLIAGISRKRDVSSEGFMGIEGEIAEELIKSNKIYVDNAGLRLWGWRRKLLVDTIAHTVIPFLPGLTGKRDDVLEFISRLGFSKPEDVHSSEIAINQTLLGNLAKELYLKSFTKVKRKRSALELLSKIYYLLQGNDFVSLIEVYGALYTIMSLGSSYLYNLFYIIQDPEFMEYVMMLYEKYVDVISSEIAKSIDSMYEDIEGRIIIESNIVKRPEAFELVLKDIGVLEKNDLLLKVDSSTYLTSLSIMINAGKPVDYDIVDEEQLIRVEK